MKSLLIKNGTIVTMNKNREIIQGDILVEDNIIKKINRSMDTAAHEIIDASGKIVMPGFIQTHIHLTQTLFRGIADDLELLDWLQQRIWPLEASHTEESNYVSARLGIAELIKGGTTSIIDMETVNHTDAAMHAIYESGFRAISGKCMMDYGKGVPGKLLEAPEESLRESETLLKKWNEMGNGRLRYAFAPRFVISCSEELLKKVRDLSREYNVMVHTHASENRHEIEEVEKDRGMRNIKYLHKLGLTGEKLLLAHCVWVDDEEIEILAGTGTKVSHCPNSNLKLASGIAKIPELISAGVNISIGADGAPCNNNLDIFKEMRSSALIQKARLLDPTAMPAHKVYELATLGGARAMGMEDKLGSLEEGKLADIVLADLKRLHISPAENTDIISALVYSANASDITDTIIDGKVLMKDRVLAQMNEKSIIEDANRIIRNQMKYIRY